MQDYPVITALTAGVIVIIQMGLMLYAASGRGKYRQGLGDGGKPELLQRMRMHGNLTENAPIILIVMGLLETAGVAQGIMAVAGAIFVLARVMHPLGLMRSSGTTAFRFVGAISTTFLGFAGGVYLIVIALQML